MGGEKWRTNNGKKKRRIQKGLKRWRERGERERKETQWKGLRKGKSG